MFFAGLLVWKLYDSKPLKGDTLAVPAPVLTPIAATTPQIPETSTTSAATAPVKAPNTTDLDPQGREQIRVLTEILNSRNDNDPRLDKDLKVLNEATKAKLREMYKTMPQEKFNDRGTLVFLLGRNLTTPADFAFMKDVLSEPPCLSLADCSRAEPSLADKAQGEHPNGTGVTLAYPQLVTLQMAGRFLTDSSSKSPALVAQAEELLQAGTHSNIPEVARMAESLSATHARH